MAPALVRGPALTVGELARRLGVHPATLRTWEEHGILRPEREQATGYREYGSECVRDAEIARQLRRGGYRLSQVAQFFLDSLREAGGADALSAFLESWQDRLTTRSRNLLAGAAQLDAYLTMQDQDLAWLPISKPVEASVHKPRKAPHHLTDGVGRRPREFREIGPQTSPVRAAKSRSIPHRTKVSVLADLPAATHGVEVGHQRVEGGQSSRIRLW